MKKSDVKIDDILSAKSEEELTKPFIGKVGKIYENSALLTIIDYDEVDDTAVSDLNQKIVVNFKNLKEAPKRKIKEIQAKATSDIKVEKIAKVEDEQKVDDKKAEK